jgi:hypothetical protein
LGNWENPRQQEKIQEREENRAKFMAKEREIQERDGVIQERDEKIVRLKERIARLEEREG